MTCKRIKFHMNVVFSGYTYSYKCLVSNSKTKNQQTDCQSIPVWPKRKQPLYDALGVT